MKIQETIAMSIAALVFAGIAVAAQPADEIPAAMRPPADAPPAKIPPLGPYAVTIVTDSTLPKHVIYRPSDLTKFAGGKLPIVAFGNGGCADNALGFIEFLRKVASDGFMIVVPGTMKEPGLRPPTGGAPGGAPPGGPPGAAPGGRPAGPPGGPPGAGAGGPPGAAPGGAPPPGMGPATTAKQMIEGIDWAIAQNSRKGGEYEGKLATTQIAVMGQSCGGLMTIEASADPRIKTSIAWNSGTFPAGPMSGISGASKASLQQIHAPIAYFIGGPTDIAYANAEDDYKLITKVPVFKANLNVGHIATFIHPNGGWFAEVGTNWLAWQLKGDKTAAKMFEGADCGLCKETAWKVEKKNMK